MVWAAIGCLFCIFAPIACCPSRFKSREHIRFLDFAGVYCPSPCRLIVALQSLPLHKTVKMSMRPPLFTRGLSSLSQSSSPNDPADSVSSPAEQRDDAKRNFLKTMRALPTQHYWNVYFDRPSKSTDGEEYKAELEQLGTQIESVQDFWRYNNNTPVVQMKMRESIYLFKSGFKPIWEDRRNINGGSWTFRVPKNMGPDMWTRVQMLAIGDSCKMSWKKVTRYAA